MLKNMQSRTIKSRTNGASNTSRILGFVGTHKKYLKKNIFPRKLFIKMARDRLCLRLVLKLSLLFFTFLGASSDIHEQQLHPSFDGVEDQDYQNVHESTLQLQSPLPLQPYSDYQQRGAFMNNFQRFLNAISHQRNMDGKLDNQLPNGIETTTRKKKNCNLPVMTRRLFGSVMKRSPQYQQHFAETEQEMKEKAKNEDASLLRMKRNEGSDSSCSVSFEWIDMGLDHYPRYVKNYHCSSTTCVRGFGFTGECKPKHYETKVLKRISPSDTVSVEDCDHTLPQALRSDWKFIDVTVVTCCDCVNVPINVFG